MRPISVEVLARNETASLAAAKFAGANCAGRGADFDYLESQSIRRWVIDTLRTEFCDTCPLLANGGCDRWAVAQRYTGLAAGAAYVNGIRKDAPARRGRGAPKAKAS